MDIKNFLQTSYKKENFIEFISNKFKGFEENDTDYEVPSQTEQESIQKYKFFGSCELSDNRELGFFEFVANEKKDIENNRVSFNKILEKRVGDEFLDGAIAVFYNPSNPKVWRLSFIQFSYDENNKQIKPNLKRYTFVLGVDIPTKTALSQLEDFQYPTMIELKEVFSVEKVSKEFFREYKELYFDTCDYLQPQLAHFENKSNLKLFTKKLLGRIVFLYFLEKKGWLGSDKNWENGDTQFLTKQFKKHLESGVNNYFYNEILEPIFFEALNEKRDNDYFPKLNCKMPFLNGGLFSKDEFDKRDIIIENHIFKNIFDIFDSYNFTIIEDTPDDSEVAIDPEMLGRVFEDLLEDRKDKGAFYTPREIVHYMCQQSISNYLSLFFDDTEAIEELILKQSTDNKYIRANAKAIQEKLFNIKVLDPAIGSGAFPMGMLHEIVAVLSNIDKTADIGVLKRKVIENSIYGIDIEQSAVEIAKLRFWLSIVVDEDKPTPLPNLFYKIMVGNSLIETINGYDPLEKDNSSLFDNKFSIDEMQDKLHSFFNESDTKKKNKLQKNIELIIDEVLGKKLQKHNDEIRSQLDNISVMDFDNKQQKLIMKLNEEAELIEKVLKRPTTELFFYKLYFSEGVNNGGFDMVICNPPYLRVQGIDKKSSEQYKKIFDSATGSYDLYVLFTEKALELLSKNGIVNYIMPHKWINASFGKGLRTLAKDKISKFISFGAYQVFNASTYTSLVWLQNNKTT
ncbi:MAG: Eco57I restriction-modification methylase domain-containing protein, partial [Sulfurovum sp.]|nr:Eco57I restriction-modification methylase domain-containing protein [Sulfurovaceae bacterium]